MLEKADPVNHEAKDDISGDLVGDVEGDIDLINEPITKDEVTRALISLKNGKAPGPDGIIGEMFKNASDVVLDLFCLLSYLMKYLMKEYILKTGQTQSITLYTKKGNPNDPSNYKGISLSDVGGKLFSTIINCRLQMWVDMNETIGEQQAGFRKDSSTVDHIFYLACYCKTKNNNNKTVFKS